MENLKDIDIGSSLLSIAIASGFIAFILLLIRTIIISLRALINQIKGSESSSETKKVQDRNKGF
tara:strand:- start:135 stop:326 length:192 start_codon:yes stop_codon:yes gene_type:complete